MLGCATNQDSLLLVTLQKMEFPYWVTKDSKFGSQIPNFPHAEAKCNQKIPRNEQPVKWKLGQAVFVQKILCLGELNSKFLAVKMLDRNFVKTLLYSIKPNVTCKAIFTFWMQDSQNIPAMLELLEPAHMRFN